jgi:hypothetical protein
MGAAEAGKVEGARAVITTALDQIKVAAGIMAGSQDQTVAPAAPQLSIAADQLSQGLSMLLEVVAKLAEAAP